MRTQALGAVKARLSEVVDAVEHRGARILITRHGKPAAAIVPLKDVREARLDKRPVRRRSRAEVERFLAAFGKASAGDSAVEQLRRDRR